MLQIIKQIFVVSLLVFILVSFCDKGAAHAGKIEDIDVMTAQALVAGTTNTYIFQLRHDDGWASDGVISLTGQVVSATDNRQLKIQAFISSDNSSYALDNTLVADWSSNNYVGDNDTYMKVGGKDGITVGKAPYLKLNFIGLTGLNAIGTFDLNY